MFIFLFNISVAIEYDCETFIIRKISDEKLSFQDRHWDRILRRSYDQFSKINRLLLTDCCTVNQQKTISYFSCTIFVFRLVNRSTDMLFVIKYYFCQCHIYNVTLYRYD